MSTIVTIQSTDIIANSRTDLNTNFANLNTDKVEGPVASVDSEIALFSGTGGKTLKRGTGTGFVKTTSGVISNVASIVESDFGFTDLTTADVTSTKHGLAPKSPADATKFLNGATTPAYAQVKDSDLSTSDITTNDLSTSKHGFAPKAPNDTTKFLRGDGTWSTISATPSSTRSTSFETAARFNSLVSGGTNTYGINGISMDTTSTTTRCAGVTFAVVGASGLVFAGSPSFSAELNFTTLGTTGSVYAGIGTCSVAGSGHTFTNTHAGFKILISGSVATLYATQAASSTETASSALTTLVANDSIAVYLKFNGSSSVDYYWSKNGGAWSAATNLATNVPSGTGINTQVSVANDSTATQHVLVSEGIMYQR